MAVPFCFSKTSSRRWTLALLVAFLGLGGCAGEDPTAADVPAVGSKQLRKVARDTTPKKTAQAQQAGAGDSQPAAGEVEQSEPTAVEKGTVWEPPFPERTDLFRQPNLRQLATAKRAGESSTARIELKGFIRVAGLRALLAVDDVIAAMKEGDQRGGVELIEISPPSVTLQRGRVRWKERLFEGS